MNDHEAAQVDRLRLDTCGRGLEPGLPGYYIGERPGQFARAAARPLLVGPVDRRKHFAGPLALTDTNAEKTVAEAGNHTRKSAVGHARCRGIAWMDFDQRLLPMPGEPRRKAGARHRMPLVAVATGVQRQ